MAMILFLSACNNLEQLSDTDSKDDDKTITSSEIETSENMLNETEFIETKPEANSEDFTYTENDNGEIIITCYTGKEKDVVFPASIEGKPVIQIGDDNDTVVSEDNSKL